MLARVNPCRVGYSSTDRFRRASATVYFLSMASWLKHVPSSNIHVRVSIVLLHLCTVLFCHLRKVPPNFPQTSWYVLIAKSHITVGVVDPTFGLVRVAPSLPVFVVAVVHLSRVHHFASMSRFFPMPM